MTVNAAELLEALLERGVTPDVVTDLTSAHDMRHGYVPWGMLPAEATALRTGDPGKLEALARATIVRHVEAMLALRERGAVVFDYGNNIRPHAASAGLAAALSIDIFTARYIRPAVLPRHRPVPLDVRFGRGRGRSDHGRDLPRAVRRRGAHRGVDRARSALRAAPRAARADRLARARRAHARSASPPTPRLPPVACAAPIAFSRDHMDGAAMTHPNIITEAMADGSDAISDWPLLNALLMTATGADLVALHAGGGGYAGYSQSAGMTVVATGSEDAAARLRGALDADTALGVLRHADAGYPTRRTPRASTGSGLSP